MDTVTQAFHSLIKQANQAHFTYNQYGAQAAGYMLAKLIENAETMKAYMENVVEVDK